MLAAPIQAPRARPGAAAGLAGGCGECGGFDRLNHRRGKVSAWDGCLILAFSALFCKGNFVTFAEGCL